MCGILALLLRNKIILSKGLKQHMLEMARELRHRGPDANGYVETDTGIFLHERLSIIDPSGGSQPIVFNDGLSHEYGRSENLILTVNGEIYNHKELRKEFETKDIYYDGCSSYPYVFQTGSDCEVINALYLEEKHKDNHNNTVLLSDKQICHMLDRLDGQFSFILCDDDIGMTLVARDPFGITPLYYGIDKNNNVLFASEMKALKLCDKVFTFKAGHYIYFCHRYDENLYSYDWKVKTPKQTVFDNIECKPYFKYGKFNKVYNPYNAIVTHKDMYKEIREIFETAVHKRLMSDVPFGVLLSGGLDSSLVASITQRYLKEHPEFNSVFKNLNSFSIGLEDSPDLIAAKKVADYIGTTHHNFHFTIEEGIAALRDVIYHLETYDVTTIRASIPMYLLSRKIKSLGIKMVLSGEGSDELLGGYLYFHKAPTDEAHQMECKRRLLELGYFDCLRANKSTMAWGLEARTPFLDKEFVDYCIELPSEFKGTYNNVNNPLIEKHCLRKAFDLSDDNGKSIYLPSEILWRQKEQFSDGVGYGWIDHLKNYTEKNIDDHHYQDFCMSKLIYPYNTPDTKEAFYYRMIFEELFPNRETTVKKWIPMTEWKGVGSDPSGRSQSTHIKVNVKSACNITTQNKEQLIDETIKDSCQIRKNIIEAEKKEAPNYKLLGL
jgi:asparagine synthase (glutamine-hydrolysing)